MPTELGPRLITIFACLICAFLLWQMRGSAKNGRIQEMIRNGMNKQPLLMAALVLSPIALIILLGVYLTQP